MPNLHTVTPDAWVKVTNEPSGSLFHQKGGDVALTEATELPVTAVADTALLDVMSPLQSKVYFGVPAGNAIYARALNADAKLTNTPAE